MGASEGSPIEPLKPRGVAVFNACIMHWHHCRLFTRKTLRRSVALSESTILCSVDEAAGNKGR